jgi:hypothetical protein
MGTTKGDYEYKVRLHSQKEQDELFDYYVFDLKGNDLLEIDCMNIRVGFGNRMYYQEHIIN